MVDQLDKFTDGPRCLAVGSLIDDHSSYSSDFESLSSISVSSTSSEFSEIEQVILEEVNENSFRHGVTQTSCDGGLGSRMWGTPTI